jgi:hypothetical protein
VAEEEAAVACEEAEVEGEAEVAVAEEEAAWAEDGGVAAGDGAGAAGAADDGAAWGRDSAVPGHATDEIPSIRHPNPVAPRCSYRLPGARGKRLRHGPVASPTSRSRTPCRPPRDRVPNPDRCRRARGGQPRSA